MINHNPRIRGFPLKFRAASPHGINPNHAVLLVLLLFLSPETPPATAQSTRASSSDYPYGPDVDFKLSLTVIIIVLVCASFFIGFFLIFIRQCMVDTDNTSSSPPSAANNNSSRPSMHGLDSSLINSFPLFAYSSVKDLKIGKGALECAVCITEFEEFDTLLLLPKCDHVFHTDCIDAWLASHATCPVCRANLTPEELAGDKRSDESIHSSENLNSRSGESEDQIQVSIDNDERDTRSVSVVDLKKFPRSHSTGHSLVQPGENCERYTLRLPNGVQKEVVRLSRTTSCVVVLRTEESSRRGSEDGSSRGRRNLDRFFLRSDRVGRWGFSMTPPFLMRTGSSRSPKVGSDGDGDGTVESSSKIFLTSVKTPFGCLAGGKGVGSSNQ